MAYLLLLLVLLLIGLFSVLAIPWFHEQMRVYDKDVVNSKNRDNFTCKAHVHPLQHFMLWYVYVLLQTSNASSIFQHPMSFLVGTFNSLKWQRLEEHRQFFFSLKIDEHLKGGVKK